MAIQQDVQTAGLIDPANTQGFDQPGDLGFVQSVIDEPTIDLIDRSHFFIGPWYAKTNPVLTCVAVSAIYHIQMFSENDA